MKSGLVVGQDYGRQSHKIRFFIALMALAIGLAVLAPPQAVAGGCLAKSGSTALYTASSWPNTNVAYPVGGKQPTLFILVENPLAGVTFNTQLRDPKIWAGRLAEMDKFYNEVSMGKMRIVPAVESYGTLNDGVIGPISIGNLSTTTTSSMTPTLAWNAILAAGAYVNYARFDTNQDARLDANELHIVIIQAGYEETYDPVNTPYPSVWMHSRSWSMPVFIPNVGYIGQTGNFQYPGLTNPIPRYYTNNVGITSYNYVGSQIYTGPGAVMATPLGPFVHLIGHDIGLPDLDGGGGVSGDFLGLHCLMSMGQWGGNGSLPVHPDALLKQTLSWENIQQVLAPLDGTFTMPATMGTNQSIYVQSQAALSVPGYLDDNQGFLIENRQHIGYDAGLPGTQGGLAIYHIDLGPGGSLNQPATNPRISMVQAGGSTTLAAFGGGTFVGLNPFGSETDYYRAGNNITLNDLTRPNSNLYPVGFRPTGNLSDVAIDRVSASLPVMTFDVSQVVRIGFTYALQYASEGVGITNMLLKLDRQSKSPVTVSYSYAGGSAMPGALPGGAFSFTETTYQASPGPFTVSFNPGETYKSFGINVNNDAFVNGSRSATFMLSNPHGGILDTTHSALRTVFLDNDNSNLNVVTPNGGEVINRGSAMAISWYTNPSIVGNSVRVDLYANGVYYTTLSGGVTNNAGAVTFTYNIPATFPVGFKYRVAVTSNNDPTYTDKSDNDFSIVDPNFKIVKYVINDGVTPATKRDVKLNITVPSGVTAAQYMASEDANFTGASWLTIPVAPVANVYSIPFTLSKGNSNKWVYVKIRSAALQETPRSSNWIKLVVPFLPPMLQAIASANVIEHVPYTSPTPVILSGDLPVMWTLVAGPPGAVLNPANGVVTWKDPNLVDNPANFTLRATNSVGFGEAKWTLTVQPATIGNAVDSPALPWRSWATPWFYQTAVAADRIDAARSGAIPTNGKSAVALTVTGPGTMTFWWKVSSLAGTGKLGFYIGGVLNSEITGDSGWQFKSVPVPAGTWALDWVYSKTGSGVAGMDAGFLDSAGWSPAAK